MSDSTTSKMIKLKSNDGEEFVVPETVAKQSQTISLLIEGNRTENCIPLRNVSAPILAKVIEYCRKHVDAADASKTATTDEGSKTMLASSRISDEELRNWDKQFLDIDKATLFDLIMAANYLNIEGLLDLTCRKMAENLMGKSPEEIRQAFNIKNDFTAKEVECASIISGLSTEKYC